MNNPMPAADNVTREFFNCIDMLIDLHHRHRERFNDARFSLDPVTEAMSYRTVRVTIGRQSGQSSYIAARSDEKDVVITASSVMVAELRRMGVRATVIDDRKLHLLEERARSGPIPYVYVDESSYTRTARIYAICSGAQQTETTFLLLGSHHEIPR